MIRIIYSRYIYICYLLFYIVILFWWSTLISSKILYDMFTYNYMAPMSLRIRSHVKESMVLTRANTLFIHNYIISLLNIIVMVRMGLEPACYCLCVWRLIQLLITIYIYIYIFVILIKNNTILG